MSGAAALELVVMARWPAPGRCKSRLAAGIGRRRAALVQQRLIRHTLATAHQTRRRLGCRVVLAVQGLGPRACGRWGAELGCDGAVPQGGGGLGTRLQRQVRRALSGGADRVVLIGSDLPGLDSSDLEAAFAGLERHGLVLGPAGDGGYWLIGLDRSRPSLLAGIPWGSALVLRRTLAAAAALDLSPQLLALRHDLDRAADLVPWR